MCPKIFVADTQKKDRPRQSFFWYDNDYEILSMKIAEYNFIVGVITNDSDKDLRARFQRTLTIMGNHIPDGL